LANAAVGWYSLFSNGDGSYNTGVGAGTLLSNGSGTANTAIGTAALLFNTSDANTAVGATALLNNGAGFHNSAFGTGALMSNTLGEHNTAVGYNALFGNIDANFNTAVGAYALAVNNGGANTAVGNGALANNVSVSNTAVGFQALVNATNNNNTALGYSAGHDQTTGSNNIYIGADEPGVAGENNTVRIGDNLPQVHNESACYIGGIYDQGFNNQSVLQVGIDSTGKLGTFLPSSRRFKKEIKPMDKSSEAILGLKPVTFQYKSDAIGTPQFGLIAEDVAEVSPDLVVRDKNGEIYTVRYEAVNAMLLNEFLKEHRKTEKLEATVASLVGTVREQAAQIQKVSAQLELNKSGRQVAENNH
jgi:hypothetical protein